jgi:hypothetical protein
LQIAVFWDAALCSLVDTDPCFRGAYCLHHQLIMEAGSSSKMSVKYTRQKSVTYYQKAAIFILVTVKSLNLNWQHNYETISYHINFRTFNPGGTISVIYFALMSSRIKIHYHFILNTVTP